MSLFGTCIDILKKHYGKLDYEIEITRKKIYNPISCFFRTVQWIMELPLKVLLSFGIITYKSRNEIVSNLIYKLLILVINILGVISAIMTIVLGWENFLTMISELI